MRKLTGIWIAAFLSLSLYGCSDDSGPTGTETEVDEASDKKQFVWNAMNYWYYWQGDVTELQDSYFADDQEFQNYLRDFNNAEALFNELTVQQDGFSFFIDNYEEFEQSQRGISESFGYQYGLVRMSENSNELFGYVQYILPDSPAEQAGLERGDIFTGVDDTRLTTQNYQDLLMGKTSYELSLAQIQDSTVSETGETVSLQAVTLQENPIYTSKVITEGSTQIGYVVYNAFQMNSHQNLNDVFGTFVSEGVDELVVDLRYNGGGTGITSQILAGMISGIQDSSEFATYSFNSKRAPVLNSSIAILDQVPLFEDREQTSEIAMNQLSIDQVYFLVGFGTASASELLINGLKPYMDVTLIGDKTVGKDQGSYTLYDAPVPYIEQDSANTAHSIAIQPIVLKLVNKNDRGYPEGFLTCAAQNPPNCMPPNYAVNEVNYLADGLPPLGSENDPLLAKALELITGQSAAKTAPLDFTGFNPGEMLIDSRDLKPYKKQLYLQPDRAQN